MSEFIEKIATVGEALQKASELKRHLGKQISNIGFQLGDREQLCRTFEFETGIIFVVDEENRKRAYFSCSEPETITELVSVLPCHVVLELIYRDKNELEAFFIRGGMEKYTAYLRVMTWYHTSPFEVHETGRRKLLEDMYDPSFGEFPVPDDIEELDQLTRKVFDPVCDEIFSKEKWLSVIENKEILVYRAFGQIISYYVWRYEGKKLYNNLSVNLGTANVLYNLERRIFEEAWNRGIRIFYSWINLKNKVALARANKNARKCIERYENIYNVIYVKK